MNKESWREWLKNNHGDGIVKLVEEPAEEDRNAAWVLYNELRTRITHEPLRYRGGNEAAALKSLHDMFNITRTTIRKHGAGAQRFAHLAGLLLNQYIRPVTSTWHQKQLAGKLDRQDHRRLFRRDLRKLQGQIGHFVQIFGTLAEPGKYDPQLDAIKPNPKARFDSGSLWPTKLLGPRGTRSDDMYKAELGAVQARWKEAFQADLREQQFGGLGEANVKGKPAGFVGLGLSGGGIRSATFALGALQALAEKKILKDIDYLSTVSGGGYVGTLLSSHLIRAGDSQTSMPDIGKILVPEDKQVETAQVRKLRNRSKSMQGDGILRSLLQVGWRIGWRIGIALVLLGVVVWALFSTPSNPWHALTATASAAALFLYLEFGLKRNKLSLHGIYRSRLSKSYVKENNGVAMPKCTALGEAKTAPYHLICATVNLPASTDPELRGRRSDFFVFSRLYTGSVLTGYCETEALENCDPELDLATAMAISGAAVSNYSGTLRRRWYSPILSLLGLGYWMPNPSFVQKQQESREDKKKPLPRWRSPGATKLYRERLGKFDEKHRFVNVSDGGHIENLGIYELLRRRCKFIICIDGEFDPEQRCSGLIKACRFASIDLGVRVDIDLSELRAGDGGLSQAHFALGTINYPRDPDGQQSRVGYLLYLKLSMTGNERDYIKEYRSRYPKFPHQSTADQFFDEDQFEAYRALGNHVAEDLFAEELIGDALGEAKTHRSRSWIEQLVQALEPPAPNEAKT